MNLDISRIFSRNNATDAAKTAVSNTGQNANASGVKSAQDLNLTPGSTISGQVVKSDGENATIRLQDNSLVEAKIESSVSLKENTNVYFEVNGVSSNGQVVLRSLFQNTAMGQTAQSALMQAGITPNENSLGMVSAMMENGMPIDKQSLMAMYRQVSAHPEISGANVVSMNRLDLPLTDANINQFQAYLNLEHQISEGVGSIADSAIEMMKELSVSSDGAAGMEAARAMLDVFADRIDPETMEKLTEQLESVEGELADEQGLTANGQDVNKLLADAFASHDAQQAGELAEGAEASTANPADAQLMSALKELGVNEESAKAMISENDGKQLLDFAKTMLEKAVTGQDTALADSMKKLMASDGFGQAMKTQMAKQWLIEPDKVADKESVEKFYEQLREQTGKLTNALSQALPDDSALYKQVSNLNDNLDFMHQMNQTMSYIQLPLKLAGDNAHGDLYVYTNKKNFAKDDGNVSAFLRLDMEHLGPVDVYIAMQDQKVSTNFYLRDDEIIDLISENIHILNERLEQKGYHMNATITLKEEPSNVMQEIVEDHKDNMLIGTKSFDVRA